MKTLNAFQIKLFMIFIMFLDHLHFIPGLIPPQLNIVIHLASRCVSVWFAYIAVDALRYTRNRWKYNWRILGWAIFMAIGNMILGSIFAARHIYISNNIFLTLALGVFCLNILDYFKTRTSLPKLVPYLLVGLLTFLGMYLTEGGMVVIPFMLITSAWCDKPKTRNILYWLFAAVLLLMSYAPYDTLSRTIEMLLYNCDWFFISVLPFIALYSGERGPNTPFTKYFFYIFYPAHIWLLATLGFLLS
ncbi:MAG: TraX family protein [Niameybacter sp.]|uniref:TraX family protein n=1 Tax=Niameybacter sp. TaxID=2033640 RepID=UPI002FC9E02D